MRYGATAGPVLRVEVDVAAPRARVSEDNAARRWDEPGTVVVGGPSRPAAARRGRVPLDKAWGNPLARARRDPLGRVRRQVPRKPASHPRRGALDRVRRGGLTGCAGGHRVLVPHAGIAQLVEHHLAKVGVAGSSPVSRSCLQAVQGRCGCGSATVPAQEPPLGRRPRSRALSCRRRSQVVRQRSAKPPFGGSNPPGASGNPWNKSPLHSADVASALDRGAHALAM